MSRPGSRIGLVIAVMLALALVAAGLVYGVVNGPTLLANFNASMQPFLAVGETGELVMEYAGDEALLAAQRLPRVPVPVDATDIHFAREGRVAATYWLTFTAARQTALSFAETACGARPEAGVRPEFRYDSDAEIVANLAWWQPGGGSLAGVECQPQANVTFRLLLDQRDVQRAMVYLEITTR